MRKTWKSDIRLGWKVNNSFKDRCIFMFTEIEANNCFVISLFNYKWKFSTTFFCFWSHVQPKDFLTSFSNCY